ncbi:hypothetical protein KZP23_07595 [Echinicola marina]|uniref:hypothetical protein n=1 Tax=Echinicola marina TaxID=2859768 RepID=UPI001CF6C0B6|nr:hypothetical protein [Echinicola marina]UCS94864.1 hypothetical protein KZP23_07595 [Echinicola marina]
MIILSIPYLFMDIPLLSPELSWMLIGERMSAGHFLYVDIIDDIGPLSAYTYWSIDLLVGRSWWTYKILASLIILFQVYYVNGLLTQYRAFEESSYIPGLVMVILFHLSFDFLTLSPTLLGSTFIVLALGQLFSQTLINEQNTESVLLVGIFGGLAACFHFPLVIFLPFLIITGISVSGFSFNQLLLALFGYFQPFLLCCIYFFWIGGLQEFINEFILATRIRGSYPHVTFLDLAIIIAAPLAFSVFGYLVGTVNKSITVNQQKQKQLMIIFSIVAPLSIILANRTTPYQMVVFLPGMTYFISQIFVYIRNKKQLNLLFFLFILLVPMIGYSWAIYKSQPNKNWNYTLNEDTKNDGKKILVLGDNISPYLGNTLASPYLNYRLSKRVLTNYESHEKMIEVYLHFLEEKPEVIYDQEGTFKELLQHIPALADMYALKGKGIYYLNN